MHRPLAILIVLVSFFTGCSHHSKVESERPLSPRAVRIARADGVSAEWQEIVQRCASADAVLIGENHGHPLGLSSAAALWDDILAASRSATLAMEFFERDDQAAIDDYLSGVSDEAAFLKAAGRNDGNYPPGHRAMVEAARRAGRPVVAANAPRRYVRLARTEGFDRLRGLSAEQSRFFRVPDQLPTGRYHDAFVKVMSAMESEGHDPTGQLGSRVRTPAEEQAERKRIEDTFRSQSTWDWTMAESVARSVQSGGTPTVLVVGRFHVDHDGGTALALRSLRPECRLICVSFIDRWSATDEDRGRADFVIYVGPDASDH
ncbi:MAG: ChaN family lipoprotein [Phycisphaerae bacterium]|nr:ChaN family lipoprotein [Phycisphaerae bacterium]